MGDEEINAMMTAQVHRDNAKTTVLDNRNRSNPRFRNHDWLRRSRKRE